MPGFGAQNGMGDPHPRGCWGWGPCEDTQRVNHPQPPACPKPGFWWPLSLIWAIKAQMLGALTQPSGVSSVGARWGRGCARGGDGEENRDISVCAHVCVGARVCACVALPYVPALFIP